MKRIVWHLDERRWRWASIPNGTSWRWRATPGVKVVLDGQGGDEVFAGYTNYAPQHLYGLLGSQPMRFPSSWPRSAGLHGWPHARLGRPLAVAMRLRRPMTPTVRPGR